MNKEHTPGPWEIESFGDMFEVVSEETTFTVARCTREADARLIAAAPELLKALEKLTDYAERNGAHVLGFRSLIAKATGKE